MTVYSAWLINSLNNKQCNLRAAGFPVQRQCGTVISLVIEIEHRAALFAASCQPKANSAAAPTVAKAAGEKYYPAVVPTKLGNSTGRSWCGCEWGAASLEIGQSAGSGGKPNAWSRYSQMPRRKKFGQLRWEPLLIRLSHLRPDAIKKLSASRFIQSVRIIGCDFDLLSSQKLVIGKNGREAKPFLSRPFSLNQFRVKSWMEKEWVEFWLRVYWLRAHV